MKSCPPWAGSRSDGSPPPAPPAVAVLAALLRLPAGGPGCAWRRSPPREQPSWADLGRAALSQPFPFSPTSRRPPVNLNAHAGARCSLRSKKAFFRLAHVCLNAPTGAWCSLTWDDGAAIEQDNSVSVHLQVRGAPWKVIQRAHGGVLLGPLAFRWTTAVRPSFSGAECTSRRPGRGGAASGRLFGGFVAAFSLDHSCAVGPRWSNRRSRG